MDQLVKLDHSRLFLFFADNVQTLKQLLTSLDL
jgi:hypothetical protein